MTVHLQLDWVALVAFWPAMLFLILLLCCCACRGDCAAFRPCHEADMMFARMLQRAQESGVLVMAHDVCWQGSKAVWGKQLPVVYIAGRL